MIKNIVVEVEPRSDRGKNASRRCRRAGMVPAVVYGAGESPVAVQVSPRRLEEVLHLETGRNTIFTVALAGEDQKGAVMIKELQRDPVKDTLLHVDLIRVQLDKLVTVRVPIRLVGVPEGVKAEGGVVEFVLREVEVECLPADIPEHLDVDIAPLKVNQHVSVAALPANDRVKILDDPEGIVAVVVPPRAEETPVAAEAAPEAAAEPEVIKKGKEAGPAEEPASKDKGAKDKGAKEK
jgi:large subunit ribosomal protein L25